MDKETLEALEKSICKWDAICMGYGIDLGVSNCALCLNFYLRGTKRVLYLTLRQSPKLEFTVKFIKCGTYCLKSGFTKVGK